MKIFVPNGRPAAKFRDPDTESVLTKERRPGQSSADVGMWRALLLAAFAVTLAFGLFANLFTAVLVSRVIFDSILQKKQRGAALSI